MKQEQVNDILSLGRLLVAVVVMSCGENSANSVPTTKKQVFIILLFAMRLIIQKLFSGVDSRPLKTIGHPFFKKEI